MRGNAKFFPKTRYTPPMNLLSAKNAPATASTTGEKIRENTGSLGGTLIASRKIHHACCAILENVSSLIPTAWRNKCEPSSGGIGIRLKTARQLLSTTSMMKNR